MGLMQETTTGKQPLAYYNTKLDNIKTGLTPCCQGQAVAVYVNYSVYILSITCSPHQPQFCTYAGILSAPVLRIQRCNTINPATQVTPVKGSPHDCLQATDVFLNPRKDMHNRPINSRPYFVG